MRAEGGPLVRRFGARERGAHRRHGGAGDAHQARSEQTPAQLPLSVGSARRRSGREPHLHLFQEQERCGADQQLGRSRTDEAADDRPLPRLDARADDVRHPVQHGADRLADLADRGAAERLALRGRQHARHDSHGRRGADGAGRSEGLRSLLALGRRAPGARTEGRHLALQPQADAHHPLLRGANHLVVRQRLRRQRALGEEALRAAHRLGHGSRRRLAGRAHGNPRPHRAVGRADLCRRRVPPARAARPTSR
jgi:hypothetical protein